MLSPVECCQILWDVESFLTAPVNRQKIFCLIKFIYFMLAFFFFSYCVLQPVQFFCTLSLLYCCNICYDSTGDLFDYSFIYFAHSESWIFLQGFPTESSSQTTTPQPTTLQLHTWFPPQKANLKKGSTLPVLLTTNNLMNTLMCKITNIV